MSSFHLSFIVCTLDYRENCSSSAEVANMRTIVLLLSCYCPTGSPLGCEEERPGMPRDCAGHSISPTLVIFLHSLKSCHCPQWYKTCAYVAALPQQR